MGNFQFQTLTLPYSTAHDRRTAAETLAALVREGLGFRAELGADRDDLPVLRVTFTGGF